MQKKIKSNNAAKSKHNNQIGKGYISDSIYKKGTINCAIYDSEDRTTLTFDMQYEIAKSNIIAHGVNEHLDYFITTIILPNRILNQSEIKSIIMNNINPPRNKLLYYNRLGEYLNNNCTKLDTFLKDKNLSNTIILRVLIKSYIEASYKYSNGNTPGITLIEGLQNIDNSLISSYISEIIFCLSYNIVNTHSPRLGDGYIVKRDQIILYEFKRNPTLFVNNIDKLLPTPTSKSPPMLKLHN